MHTWPAAKPLPNETGMVTAIKRFAVHDGDGIRTTVFLKGCSLHCLWCHNPEGIAPRAQLAFFARKCIACGACASACPAGALRPGERGPVLTRALCRGCGACEKACPTGALRLYGRLWSADEVMAAVREDKCFYEHSGGGVTLSGGECLCQPEFAAAILARCRAEGIRTAVDTCGQVGWEAFERVLPLTDKFLYDIKAIDSALHRRLTGAGNERILENLRRLEARGAAIEVRVPFVPECNAGEMPAIGELLRGFRCVSRVRVLPYHNLAASRYEALGMENTLPASLPDEAALDRARREIRRGIGEIPVE